MKPRNSQDHLVAQGLTIGYENTPLAKDLNLKLRAGEFVCLLGPNGAGKSTLIRTLSGMQPPLAGHLSLGEQSFSTIKPRQRARMISVVLTEGLPSGMMDAYSLVSLGRHPYSGWLGALNASDKASIEAAFEAVGATSLRGRQISELSDGERQKISIARALAQEAQVMLLDEPTAFLDLPRRVELMTILRDLARRRNMALLLSTHDLDLALRFADRLWILSSDGELAQGYPEELALNGQFAQAFASENLDWDPELGSFRTHPAPCLNVFLEGRGLSEVWTRRALERLGFGIVQTEDVATFSIHIAEAPDEIRWTVHNQSEMTAFISLANLIKWISDQTHSFSSDIAGTSRNK